MTTPTITPTAGARVVDHTDPPTDAYLRELLGQLVAMLEDRSYLTPSERLEAIDGAREEADAPPIIYDDGRA